MQTNALVQAFTYGQKPVRTIILDDEPWFAAQDVCDVLGYTNSREAIRKHCKEHGVTKRDTVDTKDRAQELSFINEANLYRLVVRSRKAEAEQFETWVMEDVLPQIRKHGHYRAPLGISDDPVLAILTATIEVRQRQIETENKLKAHDERLASLEHKQEIALDALDALPAPAVEVRELNMREQCREAINNLAAAAGISHHDAWTRAYAKFDLVHGVCLTKRIKGTKLGKLDWCKQNNKLDDLYGIICAMVERARKAA